MGIKGMSVSTLCRIAAVLQLSTDYILFGTGKEMGESPANMMIQKCNLEKRKYIEEIIKSFMLAVEDL